jgi:hypothetical protein
MATVSSAGYKQATSPPFFSVATHPRKERQCAGV